jgi:type 1 glutamine amidotransferase
MLTCSFTGLIIFTAAFLYSCGSTSKMSAKHQSKILVFSKTGGFHHNSIKVGNVAILKMGAQNSFGVDTTTDGSKFTTENLKRYAAVVFLSTTGQSKQLLTEDQKTAFEQYIKHGGGYVGVHAATDACYDWKWYGDLSGGYFGGHISGPAELDVVDNNNIATKPLPAIWKRTDEWYSFKYMAPGLHTLIKLDEKTCKYDAKNEKLKMGDHPIAWYHEYDGGRAFYTGLGHTDESYSEPLFLHHLLGGIKYAMGKN